MPVEFERRVSVHSVLGPEDNGCALRRLANEQILLGGRLGADKLAKSMCGSNRMFSFVSGGKGGIIPSSCL